MKTGIVILNYNDADNTIKMLQQIKDYSCLSKIVVVDNCSKDDSVLRLKEFESDKIVLIPVLENKGYASGNNVGLKYLEEQGDFSFVFISNPDIIVKESVMNKMIEDLSNISSVSFLGPTIIEHGEKIRGWKLPTYFVELLSTINFFHRFAKRYQRYPLEYYQKPIVKVDAIHGSFFLARLKDFQKIGYFDPNTFLYYEENILGAKAKMRHLGVYVDTSLEVFHMLSQSVDKSLKKIKKYKIMKASMFYYEKTYQHLNGFLYFFLKFVYFCSLIVSYLTFWI